MPVTLPTVGSLNWGSTLNTAITNLSAILDAQHLTAIASGSDVIPFVASNTGSKLISFPGGRFASPPVVMVTTSAASVNWLTFTGLVTANNFTCYMYRRDGTSQTASINFQWLAVMTT